MCRLKRRVPLASMNRVKVRSAPINVELKNVRPVVMAGEVMPQLHCNSELEIALGIENAFLRSHWPGKDPAVRPDDETAAAAIRISQELFRRCRRLEQRDHMLVHRAASGDDKCLAHLGKGLRINGNAVALEQASPAMRLAATASAFSEWLATSPYATEVTPDTLLSYLSGVPEVYGADARPKKLEWMIRQAKSVSGR